MNFIGKSSIRINLKGKLLVAPLMTDLILRIILKQKKEFVHPNLSQKVNFIIFRIRYNFSMAASDHVADDSMPDLSTQHGLCGLQRYTLHFVVRFVSEDSTGCQAVIRYRQTKKV